MRVAGRLRYFNGKNCRRPTWQASERWRATSCTGANGARRLRADEQSIRSRLPHGGSVWMPASIRARRRTFYDVTSLHSMSAYSLTLLFLSGRIRARGWFRLLPENVRFWFLGAVLLVLFLLIGIAIIALLIVDFILKPRWIARVEADWKSARKRDPDRRASGGVFLSKTPIVQYRVALRPSVRYTAKQVILCDGSQLHADFQLSVNVTVIDSPILNWVSASHRAGQLQCSKM